MCNKRKSITIQYASAVFKQNKNFVLFYNIIVQSNIVVILFEQLDINELQIVVISVHC